MDLNTMQKTCQNASGENKETSIIQNDDSTWSNIPTKDSGNHEVILTNE